MSEFGLLLPVGLGLLGFVEPCTIGSSLLMLRFLEGKPLAEKAAQIVVFTLVRGGFIGLFGVLAVLLGQQVLAAQRAGWVVLGLLYALLGVAYALDRAGPLMRPVGFALGRVGGLAGSAALGLAFGLNIPACAAPLLFALAGGVAVGAGSTAAFGIAEGFAAMALFGIALSLPLLAIVGWPRAAKAYDRLAAYAGRLHRWIGAMFLLLGVWSIYFGLFADVRP